MPVSTFRRRQGDTPARVYVDLTDVVAHAVWNGSTCAGIPRVQLEIVSRLVHSNLKVVPFSLQSGIWRDLRPLIEQAADDNDLLLQWLRESVRYRGVYPSWRRPVEAARLAKNRSAALMARLCSPPPRLNRGDTLFVGGAYWTNQKTVNLCKRAIDGGANLVVLIHDLIPYVRPEFMGHNFSKEFQQVLSLPAHFVVTTENNRNLLEKVRKEIGAEEATQISVVPLAHEFSGAERNAPPTQASARFEPLLDLDFALCVGTVEIRKNHMMLFSVWDELAAEMGSRLPPLVVAGRRGWKADDALRRLDEFFDSGRLVFIEAPTDEELRWLYAACAFTIFPSHFEGWGLPVGESLWFGKPCAASDIDAIAQVGGDLCTYFSSDHVTTIKDAIRCLLNPEIRQIYRAKIAAAPLRRWTDVTADLERVIQYGSPHCAAETCHDEIVGGVRHGLSS